MRGFTLIELLLVIGIIVLSLTMAVPSLQTLVAKNRATTEINRIVTAIYLARHAAIKYHSTVTLCASSNGQNCQGNWHEGMLLFLDKNGKAIVTKETILLQIYGPLANADKLYWHSRNKNYLQMTPSGYLKGQNGTFLYCPANKDNRFARAIILSQTGRLRLSTDTNHDGIHTDADGRPLQCQMSSI